MTTQAKFQATLNYISAHVSSALANDLMMRIATAASSQPNVDVLGTTIAGLSTSGAGAFLYNAEARRQALRALLLCQQVYLSRPTQDYDFLAQIAGWPEPTIDYWSWRSETDLKRAIRMYMPLPDADADSLVGCASRLGPTTAREDRLSERLHNVTREASNFPIESTCYRAVQSWMLASGHVSLQWFLKSGVGAVNGAVTDDNCVAAQLLDLFGAGVMVDVSANPAQLPARLVRGDVVYMYRSNQNGKPKAGGQLGHWMVYAGNRIAWGCNNFDTDEALGVDRGYDSADIVNQILAMQRDTIVPNVRDWHFVRIFKPSRLERFPT